ncbi:PDZ domain-containing protein [Candidatus Woesearchaeota archaeon]|nr:PDZ domain-containing protein [Candidatus Woesearchaeota archaeon]
MKIKTILSGSIYGLIGLLVLVSIKNFVVTLLTLIYVLIFRPASLNIDIFIIILSIIILLIGFGFGYVSRIKENKYYKLFILTKESILVNFVVTLMSFLVFNFKSLSSGIDLGIFYFLGYFAIFILMFIFVYPFSVLAFNCYKNKKFGILSIILLLIINPFTTYAVEIVSSTTINHIMLSSNYKPCGVRIIQFADTSPAKEAGLSIGDVIIKIDNKQIVSAADIDRILSEKDLDRVIVSTTTQTFEVYPITNSNRSKIGVFLDQEYCLK